MASASELRDPWWPRLIFLFPTWEVCGVSTVQCLLAEGLAAKGFECEIVGTDLNQDEPPPSIIPHGVHHRRLVPRPLARTLLGMRMPAISRARRIVDRNLRRLLDDGKPVVLVPGFEMCWSSWVEGLPKNVKLLCNIHSDDPWWYEAARKMSLHTNRLVAVSRQIQVELQRQLGSWDGTIECIPNGVKCRDSEPVRYRQPGDPLRLLYAGRLVEKQKRVSRIPKLLQALDDNRVDFQMEIAGEGPEEGWLREACKHWKQSGRVVFLGRLFPNEVYEACRRADSYVLLSDFEGMPMGMLEAMNEGCVPLVSRNLSGVQDMVNDGVNGLLCDPEDSLGQVGILGRLAGNPERFHRLSLRAHVSVRESRFNNATMIGSYFEVLSGMLNIANKIPGNL